RRDAHARDLPDADHRAGTLPGISPLPRLASDPRARPGAALIFPGRFSGQEREERQRDLAAQAEHDVEVLGSEGVLAGVGFEVEEPEELAVSEERRADDAALRAGAARRDRRRVVLAEQRPALLAYFEEQVPVVIGGGGRLAQEGTVAIAPGQKLKPG